MQGSGLINAGIEIQDQTRDMFPVLQDQPDPFTLEQDPYPVVVRTVLDIARDSINYWQNMTYFFNKWWAPDPQKITLPFCFFQIVKYSETHRAETSQKRVILFEPPEETNPNAAGDIRNPVRQGLMQTITDNVVIHPKEYQMEIIVPFQPFGRFVRQGIQMSKYIQEALGVMSDGSSTESPIFGIEASGMEFILRQFDAAFKKSHDAGVALEQQLRRIENPANSTALKGELNPTDMVNKNSLDQMFERGSILEFKTWMGYDKKYVVITEKTAEKKGTEDDIWRVSLTVKEMPVLSLNPVVGDVSRVEQTWVKDVIDKYGAVFGEGHIRTIMPYYNTLGANASSEGGEDATGTE